MKLRLTLTTLVTILLMATACASDPPPTPDTRETDRLSRQVQKLQEENATIRNELATLTAAGSEQQSPVTEISTPTTDELDAKPTQNPKTGEANNPAGTKNNICGRTPEVQGLIINVLRIPSCQLINASELFRIKQLVSETPSVKPGDFDHMPNLQEIRLNKLQELPPEETFTGLPNLQKLVIQINQDGWQNDERPDSLTISQGIFTGLEGLESLDIKSPFPLTLEGHPLSDLEKLEYIRLERIKEISSTHLAGLNQLKHIRIVATRNQDQARPVLPRDLISHLPALERLEIQEFDWPASLEMNSLETICRMRGIAGIPDTVLTVDGKIVQYMESNQQDGRTICTFKVEDQVRTIRLPAKG